MKNNSLENSEEDSKSNENKIYEDSFLNQSEQDNCK